MTSYLDPLKCDFFAHFTLLQGVRKDFFFHPKWSKLCKAPLMDPKNHSILKKLKKIFLTPYLDPLKMCLFCARFTLFQGVRKYLFSSKMEQTLQSLSCGS